MYFSLDQVEGDLSKFFLFVFYFIVLPPCLSGNLSLAKISGVLD